MTHSEDSKLRAEVARLRAKHPAMSDRDLLRIARNAIKARQAKADIRRVLQREGKSRRKVENHVRMLIGGAAIAVSRFDEDLRAKLVAQILRGPVRDEARPLLARYLGAAFGPSDRMMTDKVPLAVPVVREAEPA